MFTSTFHVHDCLDMRYGNSHEVDHEYDIFDKGASSILSFHFGISWKQIANVGL